MLDLQQFNCLGEALSAAVERWPDQVCLIEVDRDREKARLTYREFKEAASPLARALQDAGLQSGTRAAIIMTNQSKWLISAYAIFFAGGVLVPLDCKLTATEHLALLAHSKAEFLIIEYHLWRGIMQADGFENLAARSRSGHRSAAERGSRRSEALGGLSRHESSPCLSRAHAKIRHASSILPGPRAARRVAFSRTKIISNSAWQSRRSFLSGPARTT